MHLGATASSARAMSGANLAGELLDRRQLRGQSRGFSASASSRPPVGSSIARPPLFRTRPAIPLTEACSPPTRRPGPASHRAGREFTLGRPSASFLIPRAQQTVSARRSACRRMPAAPRRFCSARWLPHEITPTTESLLCRYKRGSKWASYQVAGRMGALIGRCHRRGRSDGRTDLLEREFIRCWPWLAAAIERYGLTHRREHVWAEIESGRAQHWPSPNAAMVTVVRSIRPGL